MKVFTVLYRSAVMFSLLLICFNIHDGESVEVVNQTVDVTEETVTPNVTCTSRPNVTVNVTDEYEHVQNPDMSTVTEFSGDTFRIEDVDVYGELYGSSMAPTIMDGDTVVSTEFRGQSLQEGMIVRANVSGEPVIHRIVGNYQEQGWLKLSGDSEDSVQSVKTDQVTHVVKAVVY